MPKEATGIPIRRPALTPGIKAQTLQFTAIRPDDRLDRTQMIGQGIEVLIVSRVGVIGLTEITDRPITDP